MEGSVWNILINFDTQYHGKTLNIKQCVEYKIQNIKYWPVLQDKVLKTNQYVIKTNY